MDNFELTPQEVNSPLAQRLVAHLNVRLDELRRANDYPMSPEKTAEVRGKIVGIKNLIDLLAPPASD